VNKQVKDKIVRAQSQIRGQFKDRAWVCPSCNYVLGVFDEDYSSVVIKSQRVLLTVSGGSIKRKCYRCEAVAEMSTRSTGETREDWVEKHKSQLAQPPE